ncbi:MAG: hypothetical protein VX574_11830 [Myxococcota bacterium]|nr:hypothetical protein [Myxococcota bacterium]
MYRKFLNARSPMRLLEKGLHGGLGVGNVGMVIAGHGIGKTSFLVSVALDELLRGGGVMHIALDQTVSHVRDHYDTLYETLVSSTHLEDAAVTHAEIDQNRSIRSYPAAGFGSGKVRQAVKIDSDAGVRPTVLIIEGFSLDVIDREEVMDIRALADELAAEVWISVAVAGERVGEWPPAIRTIEDVVSVILALEPGEGPQEPVALRALKDHDNPDVGALRVALDPKTLLLIRH